MGYIDTCLSKKGREGEEERNKEREKEVKRVFNFFKVGRRERKKRGGRDQSVRVMLSAALRLTAQVLVGLPAASPMRCLPPCAGAYPALQ